MESKKYEVKYTEKEYSTDISAMNSAEEELVHSSKYDVQFENALSFLLNPNENQIDLLRLFDSNNATNTQHFVFMGDDKDNKRAKARQYKKLRLSYQDIVQDISQITISSDSEVESNTDMKQHSRNKKERNLSNLKGRELETKTATKRKKENSNQKDKPKTMKDSVKELPLPELDSLNNAEDGRDGKPNANSHRRLKVLETISLPEHKITKNEKKERKKQKDKKKTTKESEREPQLHERTYLNHAEDSIDRNSMANFRRGLSEFEATSSTESRLTKKEKKGKKSQKEKKKTTKGDSKEIQLPDKGPLNNTENSIDRTPVINSRRGLNEFETTSLAKNKTKETKKRKEAERAKRKRSRRAWTLGQKEADLGRELQEETLVAYSAKKDHEDELLEPTSLLDTAQKELLLQDNTDHKGTVHSIHKKLDQSAPAVEPIKTILGVTHHQVLHLPLSDVKIKTLISSSAASKISKHVLKSIISHSHTIFSHYHDRRLFCILCIEVALHESRGFKKVINSHEEVSGLLEQFLELLLENTRSSPTPSNRTAHKNPYDYSLLSYIGNVLIWARNRQAKEENSTFFERYNINVKSKDIQRNLGGYFLWDALHKTSTINSKRWKHIIKFRKVFAYEEDQFLLILRFMNIGEEIP